METKFEIGDVVRLTKNEYWGPDTLRIGHEGTVSTNQSTIKFAPEVVMVDGFPCYEYNLELVRRASAQREGGFRVGQRVRVKGFTSSPTKSCFRSIVGELGTLLELATDPDEPGHKISITKAIDRDNIGTWFVHPDDLEPADTAPAQQECSCYKGYAGYDHECETDDVEPPQPAPMTRAAMVLAGMTADPYAPYEHATEIQQRAITDSEPRNEAARLRMAKMSLDRELTHDPKRWAQLYGPVNPITSRAVRGRR